MIDRRRDLESAGAARIEQKTRKHYLADERIRVALAGLRDLALSPSGGYARSMSQPHLHATHPGLVKRLRRADGHLRHVIGMIGAGKPCADIALQLQAVEKAITAAKRTLIHDHIDHCLTGGEADLAELRALAKLL